jgi:hypothetical protein
LQAQFKRQKPISTRQLLYMHPLLRTLLIIIAAVLSGSAVNMGLVLLGPILVPPPAGVDMNDMDAFAAAVDQMGPLNFLFPFLAHALGTLTACFVCARFAAIKRRTLTYALGVFFLCGGIAAATMIPAPLWFVAVDLLFAYLPMAWLALALTPTPEDPTTP